MRRSSVNNFVFLARDHYFDGVTFHRVIPGFVAQAGDPTGTGRGGPGYTIKDEVNAQKFVDGYVGMAKTSAPNSGGSQFFIDYAPQPNLDGGYTRSANSWRARRARQDHAPRSVDGDAARHPHQHDRDRGAVEPAFPGTPLALHLPPNGAHA